MSVIEWIFSSAGLLGSIASLVGVVMAYRQSTAAKEAAEHTRTVAEEARRAADATHAEVTRTLSAMNMAKFASIIHEIRGYLGYEKLELANLRMRELLIELHEIPGLMDEGIRDRLSVYQQTLGSDIIGVERQIDRVRRYASAKANGSDGEMAGVPILDVMMIIGHLEELSEFLVENEAKLKYARNS